jgi:hypothetical protein
MVKSALLGHNRTQIVRDRRRPFDQNSHLRLVSPIILASAPWVGFHSTTSGNPLGVAATALAYLLAPAAVASLKLA